SEVARRIAHEIKNPLTPIQLSAERIARNFGLRVNGGTELTLGNGVSTRSGSDGVDPFLSSSMATAARSNGNGENSFDMTAQRREELARVVDECTTSMNREVAGLKVLVDGFERFARMPPPRPAEE